MLIFDMDGTLIDSNGIWRDVDTAFLAKRGLPYTHEYYEGVAHTVFPKAAVFTKEYCHLTESTDEIMAEWMEMAGDLYTTSVPVKPGVVAYLEKCKAAGERMAVLTSSVPAHCHAALDHLGLKPYFEHIYFAQKLGMDKKEPAIYRKTAELLGVDRANLYCAGDNENDLAMLEAAAVGFTPAGSTQAALSTADVIVCDCDQGAIADVVEYLKQKYQA